MKIGTVDIPGRVCLAPMAGVTDAAFRLICAENGAAMTTTEMVSSRGLVYKDTKTAELLAILPGSRPAAAQIFGSEPSVMAEGAALALEISGADMLDINMGCPVGKVVKGGDGSALMKTPELARDIIEAVTRAVPVPVTVKIRKGWDKGSVNAVDFARMCEEAGAAAVAVHGRTRTQLYAGVADWDIIRDVKSALGIPVIASGDAYTPEAAEHLLRYTGADMVMIGRGSFGCPWIFSQSEAVMAGRPCPPLPPLSERMDTALRQTELAAEQKCEKIACLEARRHLAWYLRGVPHSGYYKKLITSVSTLDEVRKLIKDVKRDLR